MPALVAHIAAYRDGLRLDALRDYLQANMRYVADTLNNAFPRSAGSRRRPTAWIDLRPLNVDDRALQQALIAEQKVAIMPGYTYGPEGNGFLRLNVGCPREAGTRCRRTDCRPAQPQLIRRAIYRSSRRRNAVTGAEGKDSDNHHQQDKPVVVACQRDPTDVHAEETGDDVNRQREDVITVRV